MFTVTRSSTTAEDATLQRHQWPVALSAANTSDDTPAKIFVMQMKIDDMVGPQFSCIASAIQMSDLPEDAANSEGPYYRVAEVTLLARSADAAEEFHKKVLASVQDLANNLASASRLTVVDTTTITPTEV